jgi:hypothetical protein
LNTQVQSPPSNIITENTSVAAPVVNTSADSPSPLAMHQFLQSLAAMGGSLTAQPQSPQSLQPPTSPPQPLDTTPEITTPIATTVENSEDHQEEEEETIPDL